jgi:hypothetical protein
MPDQVIERGAKHTLDGGGVTQPGQIGLLSRFEAPQADELAATYLDLVQVGDEVIEAERMVWRADTLRDLISLVSSFLEDGWVEIVSRHELVDEGTFLVVPEFLRRLVDPTVVNRNARDVRIVDHRRPSQWLAAHGTGIRGESQAARDRETPQAPRRTR